MQLLISIYMFLIGMAFGSFALAMVDRMKAGKDWVKGRSQCDHCKHKLAVKDLVPVFSWLSTGGKCRYCKKKLSIAYPLVEILTGFAFLGSYLFVSYDISSLYVLTFGLWLFAVVLLMALVVYDFRWFLLPNKIVYPLILTAFIHRIVFYFVDDKSLLSAILLTSASILITAGLFFVLHVVSKGKWIGDGDVRLGVAMGLFLPDPFIAWLSLFIASISGLVFSIPALIKTKDKMKLKIPFGPFLIIGLYFAYLFGQQLIDWYSTNFLYL